MKLTPRETVRRSTLRICSRLAGSPHAPSLTRRMGPKPRRWMGRAPPRRKVVMNASVVGVAINGYCGKNEMRGSLHSAAHDKTVSSSGRDDDFLVWFEENKSNNKTDPLRG